MAFFKFKGEKVFYKEYGKGQTIVLIHGFLGTYRVWDKIYPELAKRYRVLLLDLPGHGRSSSIGYVHSMELYAECINSLLRLKRIRLANIVGHSLGGYVALAFAELYSDKVKSLVLVNSSARGDSIKRRKERDLIIKQFQKRHKYVLKVLVESFFVYHHRLRRYWLKTYLNGAFKCSSKGIVATIRGMKERKEREIVLKFAPYPLLIVSGKYDPLITPSLGEDEAELSPLGEFVLMENSGHMILFEEPYRFTKILSRFLNKV